MIPNINVVGSPQAIFDCRRATLEALKKVNIKGRRREGREFNNANCEVGTSMIIGWFFRYCWI